MSPPLQDLIITHGWLVVYHQFVAIDPPDLNSDEEIRWWFKEDLYQARHDESHQLMDLGWYPEFEMTRGNFVLVLYTGHSYEKLLHSFRTRSRKAVVDTMNQWFRSVNLGSR